MNVYVLGGEDYCVCPYDKNHVLLARRYPNHIIRCRKAHPDMDMVVCPFNTRHEMPRPELSCHMTRCPDRERVERDLCHMKSTSQNGTHYSLDLFQGDCRVPAYSTSITDIPSSEDWEQEHAAQFLHGPGTSEDSALNTRQSSPSPPTIPVHSPPSPPPPLPILAPPTQDNAVFAYSLSMSGVGRGKRLMPQCGVPQGADTRPVASRGRGILMKSTSQNGTHYSLDVFDGDCRIPAYSTSITDISSSEDWEQEHVAQFLHGPGTSEDSALNTRQSSPSPPTVPAHSPPSPPLPLPILAPPTPDNAVFAYSLSMSGVGRGKRLMPQCGVPQGADTRPLASRGRGILMLPPIVGSSSASLVRPNSTGRGIYQLLSNHQAAPHVGMQHLT